MNVQDTARLPRDRGSSSKISFPLLSLQDVENVITQNCKNVVREVYGKASKDHIVFTPQAFDELKSIVHLLIFAVTQVSHVLLLMVMQISSEAIIIHGI